MAQTDEAGLVRLLDRGEQPPVVRVAVVVPPRPTPARTGHPAEPRRAPTFEYEPS